MTRTATLVAGFVAVIACASTPEPATPIVPSAQFGGKMPQCMPRELPCSIDVLVRDYETRTLVPGVAIQVIERRAIHPEGWRKFEFVTSEAQPHHLSLEDLLYTVHAVEVPAAYLKWSKYMKLGSREDGPLIHERQLRPCNKEVTFHLVHEAMRIIRTPEDCLLAARNSPNTRGLGRAGIRVQSVGETGCTVSFENGRRDVYVNRFDGSVCVAGTVCDPK